MTTLQTRRTWWQTPDPTIGRNGLDGPPSIAGRPVMGCAKCSEVAVLQIRLGSTTSQGRRKGFPHNKFPPVKWGGGNTETARGAAKTS